ncbi:MAG: FAD-dependent oxidoreductase [Elusimicrobia bacterium]|nr:FAD-dependent oxidoreductase [Elusimicrobiota bacterium]
MKDFAEILIIGGGPAAIVAALTARKYYPDRSVAIIKDRETGVVPCGIPYMTSSLEKTESNIMSFSPVEKAGVRIVIDGVKQIKRTEKEIVTGGGEVYSYEKLILATGSDPIKPPIKGIDLKNVFPIYKDFEYLTNMIKEIKESRRIVVLGGGFIGVEFADEISRLGGKEVYLVEMQPSILMNSFDEEFAVLARDKLAEKGVKILTGVKVESIGGSSRVEKVLLSNGKTIECDVVVCGLGGVPNTALARSAGLDMGKGKGIWVDEYMRTSDRNIFAIGDCAGKRDFFTRRDNPVMLASIATAEARIAGANLYELKVVREIKGTIGIFSTYISGVVLASAGLTEANAKKENFEVVVGNYEGVDKHPAALPEKNKIKVKLIFSKQSGILMGGQVAGGFSAGEIINIIGMGIQKNVSLTELETFQMATHPYLTPPPTKYHLVAAAQDALRNVS